MLDKALALKGVAAEMRQEGYMLKVQICLSEKKFVDVVATLKLAKEAAPESRMAKQIDDLIAQFSKVAEAQEAADKLEAGLAKSRRRGSRQTARQADRRQAETPSASIPRPAKTSRSGPRKSSPWTPTTRPA